MKLVFDMAPIKLDLSLREDNFENDSKIVVKKIRPEWPEDKIKFKLFTDGITNKLLGAYYENKEEMILIRIFGAKTELFIDREKEKHTIQLLHKYGLGPELYATFHNGIAYEYLPGVTLDRESVRHPKVFPLICDSMARLHSMPVDESEPCMLWNGIEKMITLVPEKFTDGRQIRYEKEMMSRNEIIAEAAYLKDILGKFDMPLVNCHNDALLANIIYNEAENKVNFIDFEYAGVNCQPYDVANHFNEYAGITEVDYSYFPEKDHQILWIKEYLQKYYMYSKPGCNYQVTEEEVETFYDATSKCVLASHFFWIVWAVVQAKESLVDFDFLDYGIMRLNEYKKRKTIILQN